MPAPDRLAALSEQLIHVHQELRERLTLARELDGLIAILDSHFSYEERRIARALDTLGPSAWTAEVFVPGHRPAR